MSTVALAQQDAQERKSLGEIIRGRLDRWRKEAPQKTGTKDVVQGGEKTGKGTFRETVAIIDKDGDLICSGVMIDDRAILTAAHCVCAGKLDQPLGQMIAFGLNAGSGQGAVGIGRSSIDIDAYVAIDTEKTSFYDQNFNFCESHARNPAGAMFGRDLALVFMDLEEIKKESPGLFRSRTENKHTIQVMYRGYGKDGDFIDYDREESDELEFRPYRVAPARIAGTILDLPRFVTHLVVVGFGISDQDLSPSRNKKTSGWKLFAPIAIRSRFCGSRAVRRRYGCAAGVETVLIDGVKDTCNGDSGGPVFAVINQRQYYLIGITSRAVEGSNCGAGGVYSLITAGVVRWLRSKGVVLSSRPFAFRFSRRVK